MKKKLFLLLLFPLTILAQTQIGQDIFPNEEYQQAGWFVALSSDGQTVAIGGQPKDENNITYSNARIYDFDGGNYIQKGQTIELNNFNSQSYSTRCRVSLSADGNILAVSTPYFGSSEKEGIVKIFQYNGTNWQQIGQNIVEGENDYFGYNISLSEDGYTVAVVSPQIQDTFNNILGYASVYHYNGTNWQQIGEKIEGYYNQNNEYYSFSQAAISLSNDGNKLAIGTPFSNTSTNQIPGEVRIYEYSGTTWQQLGQTLSSSINNINFGWDVHLTGNGNTLAIGNIGYSNQYGYVQIYQISGNQWVQKGANITSNEIDDFFGNSVSLSENGNTLAVSASQSNSPYYNEGNVKIFKYTNNQWSQIGNTILGTSSGGLFGQDISLSTAGDFLAIGSPYNSNYPYYDSGVVKIYSLSDILSVGKYEKSNSFVYPNPTENLLNIYIDDNLESISIYNLQGQLVKRENQTVINVSDLASGIYYIQMISKSKKSTEKFIKK